MKKQSQKENIPSVTIPETKKTPVFNVLAIMLLVTVLGSILFLSLYRPAPSAPLTTITLEQKMAHLETGAPLPNQTSAPHIPRWMMALIFGFVVIQILPLLLASYKTRQKELTSRELRQIEFLTETPLFLGLLGSLLGVCMTQFISGSLAAPLAYLTTISGILLYLFGRFTILVSLKTSIDQ